MTLSRADLVFDRGSVRSVRQRKVIPCVAFNKLLKGLILRQEGEGRGERGMRIGLQYYEERTL